MGAQGLKFPETLGRYKIKSVLGKGGMGAVFRALDPQLGRDIALKVMLWDTTSADAQTQEMIKRFEREVKAQAAVHHPNIVGIYDTGMQDQFYFFAMEMLPGRTLKDVVKALGPLSPGRVIDLGIDLCSALQEMHSRRILHRDLKPQNVFASDDGRFVVMDLGLVKLQDARTLLTREGQMVGTPMYMPPEVVRGKENDARSDLYAVGTILYEAATGKAPFMAQDLRTLLQSIAKGQCAPVTQLAGTVPSSLARVIHWAMAVDPATRPESAATLLAALVCLREGRPLPEGAAAPAKDAYEPTGASGEGAGPAQGDSPGAVPPPAGARPRSGTTGRFRTVPTGASAALRPGSGASARPGARWAMAASGPPSLWAKRGVWVAIALPAVLVGFFVIHRGSSSRALQGDRAGGAGVRAQAPAGGLPLPSGAPLVASPEGAPGTSALLVANRSQVPASARPALSTGVAPDVSRPAMPAGAVLSAANLSLDALYRWVSIEHARLNEELNHWTRIHDGKDAQSFFTEKKIPRPPDVADDLRRFLERLGWLREQVRSEKDRVIFRACVIQFIDLARMDRPDAEHFASVLEPTLGFLKESAQRVPGAATWIPTQTGKLLLFMASMPDRQAQGRKMLEDHLKTLLDGIQGGKPSEAQVEQASGTAQLLWGFDETSSDFKAMDLHGAMVLDATRGFGATGSEPGDTIEETLADGVDHLGRRQANPPIAQMRASAMRYRLRALVATGQVKPARELLDLYDRECPGKPDPQVEELRAKLP